MKKKTVVITVIIVSISAFLALLIFLGGIIFVLFGSRKISVNANTQMSWVSNILNSSVPNVNIASETIVHMGNHIYYPKSMIKNRNLTQKEEEEILDFLKDADSSLSEDVYVTGFSKISSLNCYRVHAYQYYDGVVISDVHYSSDKLGNPVFELVGDFPPVQNLDTSSVVPIETVYPDVETLALNNINKMYMDNPNKKNIHGTYQLEYSCFDNMLCYCFYINDYSYVKVDANTGQICDYEFWDGAIDD